jgi:hypothetical protein
VQVSGRRDQLKALTVTGTGLLGIVLALPVIYWLRPLNKGGIALVVLVCVGLAGLIIKLAKKLL